MHAGSAAARLRSVAMVRAEAAVCRRVPACCVHAPNGDTSMRRLLQPYYMPSRVISAALRATCACWRACQAQCKPAAKWSESVIEAPQTPSARALRSTSQRKPALHTALRSTPSQAARRPRRAPRTLLLAPVAETPRAPLLPISGTASERPGPGGSVTSLHIPPLLEQQMTFRSSGVALTASDRLAGLLPMRQRRSHGQHVAR